MANAQLVEDPAATVETEILPFSSHPSLFQLDAIDPISRHEILLSHNMRFSLTSVKQLTANRTNGKKSTGPKTKNGKDRAKMNALKHGLTAAQGVLIEGEDPEEFEAWCADFIAKYRPTTAFRHGLVLQLAVESWRLQRVAGIEGTFIRGCQEETAAEIEASFDDAYYQPLRNEAENRCYESFGHSIDAIIRAKFDGTYDSRFEEYFEQVQAEALARGHTPPERKLTKDERAQAHQAAVAEIFLNDVRSSAHSKLGRYETSLLNNIHRILGLLGSEQKLTTAIDE